MDGTYALGVVLTILGGIALAVQSGVNSTLGSTTGSKPFASTVSFAMGMAICLIYFLIDTTALKHQLPSAAGIRSAPWWAWIGGALGAYYVIIVVIFAQKLGAGTLVAIFVCAQLITSVVLDLTGLVGFARRVFSWQRLLGAAFMVVGVVLVSQFPGATVEAVRRQQAKQEPLAATAERMHLAGAAAPPGSDASPRTGGSVAGSSTASSLGRRLAALELQKVSWHQVDAASGSGAAAGSAAAAQRQINDSASSAIAAASWPSLEPQDVVEGPDVIVPSQDRV